MSVVVDRRLDNLSAVLVAYTAIQGGLISVSNAEVPLQRSSISLHSVRRGFVLFSNISAIVLGVVASVQHYIFSTAYLSQRVVNSTSFAFVLGVVAFGHPT